MSEEVMYKHIDLYVNEYSVDLGTEGRRAVQVLFETARASGVIPDLGAPLFLDGGDGKIPARPIPVTTP
jgi:1,4-dihydroxy-6-naphthoate synthase